MGVTNLWNILAPVKRHTPLSVLHGQTVAVDLSIWVCENQCVKSMQGVVSRPYLRNLFFRVSHLTQLGVRLVFVIEGTAPQLKWEEMKRRQQALGRGGARAVKGGRGNFNSKLRECCQLLDMLGVPYIHSRGEAEAMCAALNAAGLVDACITDDGDAFLYGARTVYKNFTMNNKDPHVESYSMDAIEGDLGISRETLVGVALLLGCDYLPGGVPGVGVDRVIKYLDSIKGVDLLKRFEQWKSMSPAQCVSKIENHILQKALAAADFPQRKIISEFMSEQETVPKTSFVWRRPQLVMMQDFAETKMEWVYDYTTEKILPLITFWELSNPGARSSRCLEPHRIVKSRVRQGIPVYEVEWYKQGDDTRTSSEYYTTMEDQTLFTKIFPQFVSRWEEEVTTKKTKKKTTSRKTKRNIEEDNLACQLETLNLENRQEKTAVSQTCQNKKQTREEELDGKNKRKVSHRKMAAYHETETLARVAQLSSIHQHAVCTNNVDADGGHRKPIHTQEITVSGTIKTISKKQYQETHHLEACASSHSGSKAQHLSFGENDSCFGHDNTLLSALPEIEKSRLDSSEHRLNEDRSEELHIVTKESHAPSAGGPSGDSRDEESDSDKENDDVFLTLTQRLQMKLGQTTKSKSISNGFEACLALKKTHTMTKSESSLQGRKGRKGMAAVHEEPKSPADVLLKPTLNKDMLKIKPEAPYVPERRLRGKKGRNVGERKDLNTFKDQISLHNYKLSNSKVPKRIPETINSAQETNIQQSLLSAKNHDYGVVSETDLTTDVDDVLREGMNQDPLQDSPPINSEPSVTSNEPLSLNSKETSSLLSSTANTKDFTCVAHMMTVVDTPEVSRKTLPLSQDETFGLKELHEDFRTTISELDKKQISSSSSGYCNLVNRLKEKMEQPLESRNDVETTSSLPKEMNLSSSELLQSPSFLCSQTILSGNDECFLEPEARIQHRIPAMVRWTRSGSDKETSHHHAYPVSSRPSLEQVTLSRTRSATLQENISLATLSMDMTTMMENNTSIQENTNMLQASTILQKHDALLQGNTKLIQDNNTVLQASTMLQGEGTLPQNTSSLSHTLTDATLQFGHFSMQASLLNDTPVNTSYVSMCGGNSILVSEASDNAAKTVLMSETGNVLTCDRTSMLMSETVCPFEPTLDYISETKEVFTEGNTATILLSKSSDPKPNGTSANWSETVQHLELEESSGLNIPTQNLNPCATDCKRTLSVSPGLPKDCNRRAPVLVDKSVLPETVVAKQSTVVKRNLRGSVEVNVDNLNLSLASMSIQSKQLPQDLDSADLESSGNGSYVFSTVVCSQFPDGNARNCEGEASGHQRTGSGVTTTEDGKRTRSQSKRRSKLSLRKSSSNLRLEKSSETCNCRTDESPGSGRPAEHPPGRPDIKEDHSDRPSSLGDSRTGVNSLSERPAEHLISGRVCSRTDNSEILLSSNLTVPMQSDVIDLTSGSPNTVEELTLKRPELRDVNNERSSSVSMSRNIFRDPNAKTVYPKPKTRIKSWTSKKQALFRLLEEMSDSDTDSEVGGFCKTSKPNQVIGIQTKQPSRNEYRPTAEDFNTLQRQGYINPLDPLDNCSENIVANQYKGNVDCPTRKKPQDNIVPGNGTNGNIESEDRETKVLEEPKRNVGNSNSFSSKIINSNSTLASNLDSTLSKKALSNSTSSSTSSSLSTSTSDFTSANSTTSKSVFPRVIDSGFDSTSFKHKTSRSDPVGEETVLDTTAHESPISLTDRLRSRLSNNARAALKTLSSQRKVVSSVNIKPINK